MKTSDEPHLDKAPAAVTHPCSTPPTHSASATAEIPGNSTEFRDIPSNSGIYFAQPVKNEESYRKPLRGTFAGNLSPEQRSQLFEWLADHTYDEVIELVAAAPPEGFGIKVGKTTLCRFHKAHFREINIVRSEHIQTQSLETLDRPDGHDYRAMLRDSFSQLLLERLWELLSRPVQSADELKKLTVIAEKMKSLDRDKEMIDQLRAEKNAADMTELIEALQSGPKAKHKK